MKDITIVSNIIDELIGRRVLNQVMWREDISGVGPSVKEIKATLSSNLLKAEIESQLKSPINKLIKECNNVLDVSKRDIDWRKTESTLQNMRSVFHIQLLEMIKISGITISEDTEYFLDEIGQ